MSLDVHLEMELDTGNPKELYTIELYSANITHNLGGMAREAGIYNCLWRPEEIEINEAYQLIEPLSKGLQMMKNEPKRFKVFNPLNGWGSYESFLPWIEQYLEACKKHPKAQVRVCS